MLIVIAVIAAVLLAAAALWFFLHDGNDGEEGSEGTQTTEEAEDRDDAEPAEEGGGEVSESDISVLSSDWDWDSAYYSSSSDMYQVDAILYVSNSSDTPVTGILYSVFDKDYNVIENDSDPGENFYAVGYVGPGSEGIMVGKVWTTHKKIRPNDDTYEVERVYANGGLDDYTVPSGMITDRYGPDNDYYDVMLSNYNDTEVKQSATVVAVQRSGSKIKDSDATGTIERPIPANTDDFTQQRAFNDPNLYGTPGDYEIYAIDWEYLESVELD